jgi:hypothetical protein
MNIFRVTCPTLKATVSIDFKASDEVEAKKRFLEECKESKILLPMFPDNYIKIIKIGEE